MNRQHIGDYRRHLAELHAASSSHNEGVVSQAFAKLLEAGGRKPNLILVQQKEWTGPRGNKLRIDGAMVPTEFQKPFGFWEAKDRHDDIDREITAKRAAGYPDENIIYENTHTAVLRQNGREVERTPMADDAGLIALLKRFFAFEVPELTRFRAASAKFRADLPQVIDALRNALDDAEKTKPAYVAAAAAFLAHARSAINPSVTPADVREMLIQHILTEEIFTSVFDNAGFHRENNVAKRLGLLEAEFFTGALRHQATATLKPYYNAIKHAATDIADRREKQAFLKRLYEDFYKVYNPKAADRLGVVYTPGEIVRFMIRGCDWLVEKHWGKCLIDEGVEILDPATGTGTFIVELLEHFQGEPEKLKQKYAEELHANEVAILPYYVANLNIEATYAAITGEYAEFPGLCFVDTLDMTSGLGLYAGYQHDLLGALTDENIGRIKRQNERKLSVIIGNPPYDTDQMDEDGKGGTQQSYPHADARIKATYVKRSKAKRTKLYDMYVRFVRWASDRLKNDGVIAFVSNSSFIHKNSFDGMRAVLGSEFAELWVVDLKGDARSSGENRKRQGGNAFGDQIKVGVAIYFLIKKASNEAKFTIYLQDVPDYVRAADKLAFVHEDLSQRKMLVVRPDSRHSWTDQALPIDLKMLSLAESATKRSKSHVVSNVLFQKYSLGISTNRDDWLYDRTKAYVQSKALALIGAYNAIGANHKPFPKTLKWSDTLRRRKRSGKSEPFSPARIALASYRPFSKRWIYQSELFIDHPGLANELFPPEGENVAICFSDLGSRTYFCTLAVEGLADLHFGAAVDAYQQVPRFRYTSSGKVDNITDWALAQFQTRYPDAAVTKDGIFAYTYAALHDPVWRETYAADLKRAFPRIMLHDDFKAWRAWGETLLALHIGYETVDPWPLPRVDVPGKTAPKPILKSKPEEGIIVLDSDTQLTGVPRAAWDYRLGNRSGIDWVLDQHKEKRPRDPTVAARFNTYRFADHKERVVDLLARVVRVSVETIAIVDAMRAARTRETPLPSQESKAFTPAPAGARA